MAAYGYMNAYRGTDLKQFDKDQMLIRREMRLVSEDTGVVTTDSSDPGTPFSERPQAAALIAKAKRNDTIVFAQIPGVFRSGEEAVRAIHEWYTRGIRVIVLRFHGGGRSASLVGHIDTLTTSGRLAIQVLVDFLDQCNAIKELAGEVREKARQDRERNRVSSPLKAIPRTPYGFMRSNGDAITPDPRERAAMAKLHRMYFTERQSKAILLAWYRKQDGDPLPRRSIPNSSLGENKLMEMAKAERRLRKAEGVNDKPDRGIQRACIGEPRDLYTRAKETT